MDRNPTESSYRWYILALATVTNAMVVAAPAMCMSVLFDEISIELHLNLVQVGMIWGISALPGIVMMLVGGGAGDRFGPKRVLMFGAVLGGLTGAMRGLANNFYTLLIAMFLFGMFSSLITINSMKTCGVWFSKRQLGLASGVLSMGMALGFLLGSMLSATVLSPWLGGWRQVLYFYGIAAVLLCIPWYFTRSLPGFSVRAPVETGRHLSMQQMMAYVARIRNVWLFGLTILGINGGIQGLLGYLPLYLRGMNWPAASADGALAAFHMVSLICVIPIALGSDKLGTRKKVLIVATLLITAGTALLSVASGPVVWVAVIMAGMVRDGFMAVFMTAIIETEGVGATYAGTATGMVMVFSGLGGLLAPPIGNSFATIAPGLPFLFWAALTLASLLGMLAVKERSAHQVWAAD